MTWGPYPLRFVTGTLSSLVTVFKFIVLWIHHDESLQLLFAVMPGTASEKTTALYCLIPLLVCGCPQPFSLPFSNTASYVVSVCHSLGTFLRTRLAWRTFEWCLLGSHWWNPSSRVPMGDWNTGCFWSMGFPSYLCPSWVLVSIYLSSCLGPLIVFGSLSAGSPNTRGGPEFGLWQWALLVSLCYRRVSMLT